MICLIVGFVQSYDIIKLLNSISGCVKVATWRASLLWVGWTMSSGDLVYCRGQNNCFFHNNA
jgi:hypothetical protein